LVDTLLLGFAINTMTASALSKDDYMTRDAWSMSIGRAHPDASPGLQSYDVVEYGTLAVSLLFISLGLGVALYIVLNMSEARESARTFQIWSKCFVLPLWMGYGCLYAGLYFFYRCYVDVVEIIFPLYCTMQRKPFNQLESNGTGSIFDVVTSSMNEIPALAFNDCKNDSYTYNLFEHYLNGTLLIMYSCVGASMVANAAIHLWVASDEVDLNKASLDPSIVQLLDNTFEERAAKRYQFIFLEQDISTADVPRLTYMMLREIGLTVGHANRLLEALGNSAPSVTSTHARLPAPLQEVVKVVEGP